MIHSLRNRRVALCLLASLAVHVLFLWAYQRWAAEPVLRALRPERFELAPALEPQRFEPAPRATVPEVVMEQLRLAELMEAPLPELTEAVGLDLESLVPEIALEADSVLGPTLLPEDTLSYEDALTDLYRRKLVELHGRRIRVLPLADTTSEAGRRRTRARQIIDRAIEAMGGLERLRADPRQEDPGREVGPGDPGPGCRPACARTWAGSDTAWTRGPARPSGSTAGRAGTCATDCSCRRGTRGMTPSAGTSCRGSAETA